jgi:hypothetical protein
MKRTFGKLINRWGRRCGMQNLMATIVVTGVLSGAAYAHGTAIYVSTPVSPPAGFSWVVWVSAALLVGAYTILFRRFKGLSWTMAPVAATAVTSIFGATFYAIGAFHASSSTRPPPGLGWGYHVFWGFGWRAVGSEFIQWNVIGIVALLAVSGCACIIIRKLKPDAKKGSWGLLGASVPLYIMCLTPYVSTGALTSGWMGGYTIDACGDRVAELGTALRKYADKHEGKLPEGSSLTDIMPQLEPYTWHGLRRGMPIYICPVGGPYAVHPQPYSWNAKASGKTLDELGKLKKPMKLLWCPYRHGPRRSVLYTQDLLDAEQGQVCLYHQVFSLADEAESE